MLSEAKVNMTLYDILNNKEDVLFKLVEYIVKQGNITRWNEDSPEHCEIIDDFTYKKNALLQEFCEDIYEKSFSETIFFLYITKISE